jgi:hypothetical protein
MNPGEVEQHLDSQDGALRRYHYLVTWLRPLDSCFRQRAGASDFVLCPRAYHHRHPQHFRPNRRGLEASDHRRTTIAMSLGPRVAWSWGSIWSSRCALWETARVGQVPQDRMKHSRLLGSVCHRREPRKRRRHSRSPPRHSSFPPGPTRPAVISVQCLRRRWHGSQRTCDLRCPTI